MKSRMLRIVGVVGVALIGLVAAGCHRVADANPPAPKTPLNATPTGGGHTAHDIMRTLNRPKSGLHSQVGNALQEAAIDWATLQPKVQEYSTLASSLGQNEPHKGDKASWDSMTKVYADNAQSLLVAVERKDKDSALSVHGQISQSCNACHKAHR